jgi:hypothetical protein
MEDLDGARVQGAGSPASIILVGPPPALSTACRSWCSSWEHPPFVDWRQRHTNSDPHPLGN